jgi:hypothetical protein
MPLLRDVVTAIGIGLEGHGGILGLWMKAELSNLGPHRRTCRPGRLVAMQSRPRTATPRSRRAVVLATQSTTPARLIRATRRQKMAKLTSKEIRDLARKIVASNPGGIKRRALMTEIGQNHPETSAKAIEAAIWNLDALFPNEISKPERGLFKPAESSGNEVSETGSTEQITATGIKIQESDFYAPFAEYLKELDDVIVAVSLGGASLKSKFGTPDVVGIYASIIGDFIKFGPEIVSAEIKIDPQAPVVAFGQAVAYRLFSTKTYIAMPTTMTEEDKERLESLCMLFGVGLVLFDLNKDAPAFSIRMRAQRFFPDMFYVNEFAERLKQHKPQVFKKLFSAIG